MSSLKRVRKSEATVLRELSRVGATLRDIRETDHHESVSELSRRSGVSRQTIHRIERGEVPSLFAVHRLCDALRVDMSTLFFYALY